HCEKAQHLRPDYSEDTEIAQGKQRSVDDREREREKRKWEKSFELKHGKVRSLEQSEETSRRNKLEEIHEFAKQEIA
ncbi:hypothetical protein RUM43_014682, partial [Polyplax serrata]